MTLQASATTARLIEVTEPTAFQCFMRAVNTGPALDTIPPRARKLKLQADNCIAIAVREQESGTAALLIDEAAKLTCRAQELSGTAPLAQKIAYPAPKQP